MNCKKCGSPLVENDRFCKNCGAAVENTSSFNMNMGGVVPNNNPANIGGTNYNYNNNTPINNGYQPVNQQQPSWANSYNTQANYNSNIPKNNSTKFIIIGVVLAIAIFAAIVVGISFSNKDNSSNPSGSDVDDNIASNDNYTVKFKGFTFKIPTDLVYEAESDAILLGDEEGSWAAYLEVVKGSYNQFLKNKNKLQSIYQQNGYKASSAVEKTIGGMAYITLEVSKGGTNAILGLAKANSMYAFGVTAFNQDNEFDYDLLKELSGILSSAKYDGDSNNISGFEKIDMNIISELAE